MRDLPKPTSTKVVGVPTLHDRTSEIIDEVRAGTAFLVAWNGRLVALLQPLPEGIEADLVEEAMRSGVLAVSDPSAPTGGISVQQLLDHLRQEAAARSSAED